MKHNTNPDASLRLSQYKAQKAFGIIYPFGRRTNQSHGHCWAATVLQVRHETKVSAWNDFTPGNLNFQGLIPLLPKFACIYIKSSPSLAQGW